MTFHFAYPNVLPRRKLFIGCGRYAVFSPDIEPGGEYQEMLEAPATPNHILLKRAVQLLAPDSYQSINRLFHCQDQNDQQYQGDSLDFAWFLARIHCTRELRYSIGCDIWCTGVIGLDKSGVYLLDVNMEGFYLKLEAFLSSDNPDRLFLVPLANMNARVVARCGEMGVEVQHFGTSSSRQFNPAEKSILTIAADDIPLLLRQLFICKQVAKWPKRGVGLLLPVVLFSCLAGIYFFRFSDEDIQKKVERSETETAVQLPAPENILESLKNGDLLPVKDFVQNVEQGGEYSPEALQLYNQLHQSLEITAKIHYWKATGEKSEAVFGDGRRPPVLTSADYYRFSIHMDSVVEKVWLYLLQIDANGKLALLFPSSASGGGNPVVIEQRPLSIPRDKEQWFVLDQMSEIDEEKMLESVYVLASPWPANEIMALSDALKKSSVNKKMVSTLRELLEKRAALELPALSSVQWAFWHANDKKKNNQNSEPVFSE